MLENSIQINKTIENEEFKNSNLHYIDRSCDFAGHRSVADSDCLANEGVIEEPHGPGLHAEII